VRRRIELGGGLWRALIEPQAGDVDATVRVSRIMMGGFVATAVSISQELAANRRHAH